MGSSREDLKEFPEAVQDSVGFELYRVQCGLEPGDWKSMASVGAGVKNLSCDLSRDAPRRGLRIALLPEEDPTHEPFGFGISDEAI